MADDRAVPASAPILADVLIAGGGLAGVLAAARLAMARPELKIALLEREAGLGGRLRAASGAERSFGYGLNGVTDALFEYWAQTLKQDPDGPDLATLVPRRHERAGVLAGNRITQVPIGDWFAAPGARMLGGFAASRQWGEVDEVMKVQTKPAPAAGEGEADGEGADGDEPEDRQHAFAHYWKNTRKSPASVVLEHFASAYGIPDVWGAAVDALGERAQAHTSRMHAAAWDEALRAVLDLPVVRAAVTVHLNARIVSAEQRDGQWLVEAEGGTFEARSLVVAQPPWQAVTWLARASWPPQVLQVATKTKPVSAVILAEKILQPSVDLPDVIVVPAEKAQIVRVSAGELVFQATIDYELTVQAPAVVKAVKQLKRARKKLLTLHPGLCAEANRIALQTVAWAQSPQQADRRYLAKLEKKAFNTVALAFVGDAYGASYDGDKNVLSSLHSAVEVIAQKLKLEPRRAGAVAAAADAEDLEAVAAAAAAAEADDVPNASLGAPEEASTASLSPPEPSAPA